MKKKGKKVQSGNSIRIDKDKPVVPLNLNFPVTNNYTNDEGEVIQNSEEDIIRSKHFVDRNEK